jgi:hypothetical protein
MPPHPDDGGPFFQLARTTIQQADFAIHQHPEERERITGHYERVELLLTHFLHLQTLYQGNIVGLDNWIEVIHELRVRLNRKLEELEVYDYNTGLSQDDDVIPTVFIPRFQQSTHGRPKYLFQWDIVLAYRRTGYTWSAIAALLGVSTDTLLRRRKEDNIPEPQAYSTISDMELDSIVHRVSQQSAGVLGSQFIQSAVLDLGFHVQRRRIRESILRTDPLGHYNRWATVIPRAVYSVAGPNSLWHMDGNLKLRQYGFVLHGAIDGFSRYLIYLEANLNNRADTVLKAFLKGVETVGHVPLRVRADKGSENRDVGLWMIVTRGEGRGSFITGRSVHNQRIERIWREVNRWLTSFHLIFQHLKQLNIYDPDNPVDRFVLGFVYLPLIRWSLSKFIRIWNYHKLRTEGFKTPVQLYATLTQLQSGAIAHSMLSNNDLHAYGVDWDGPLPEDISVDNDGINTTAIVEPPERPLTENHWRVLTDDYRRTLEEVFQHGNEDWMLSDYNYGVDFYREIRLWVTNRLNVGT